MGIYDAMSLVGGLSRAMLMTSMAWQKWTSSNPVTVVMAKTATTTGHKRFRTRNADSAAS